MTCHSRQLAETTLAVFLFLSTARADESVVTVLPLSPFGQPLSTCRVERFRPSNLEAGKPGDYTDHFRGLTGVGIPMGDYEAFLRCSEGALYSQMRLHVPNQFEVVARNGRMILGERGDLMLTITLDGPRRRDDVWWVRLVGLYNRSEYMDRFSDGGPARLNQPDPRYLPDLRAFDKRI